MAAARLQAPSCAAGRFTRVLCPCDAGPGKRGERKHAPMAGIVQFDNVGLRYGTGAETLAGLSFTLLAGSFHFLTRAPGAGKASLINLITLARLSSRGIVSPFGEDSPGLPRPHLPAPRRRNRQPVRRGCRGPAPPAAARPAAEDRRGAPGFAPRPAAVCL